MKTRLLSILLLICCTTISAYENIPFQVLDVKSGISDNYIQDILCDKYGFMWFASKNGLDRYDGYHFKQYPTKHLGSYDNSVEGIFEDASGTIWIKTPVRYCFYNREKDEFDNRLNNRLCSLGIRDSVKGLYVDEDRNLWCSTADSIHYYRFSEETLFSVKIPGNGELLDLTCRQSNAYLLFAGGEIATVDWSSGKVSPESFVELIPDLNHHIYLDTEGGLWLYATHSSTLLCYSTRDRK